MRCSQNFNSINENDNVSNYCINNFLDIQPKFKRLKKISTLLYCLQKQPTLSYLIFQKFQIQLSKRIKNLDFFIKK